MRLETLIASAREHGASDVHLEGGFPATFRVRGALKRQGEALPPAVLTAFAREVLGDEWNAFIERGSADLSRLLAGQRCRLNVLRTSRGVGFAIRLLTSSQATLKSLNLHPDLTRLVRPTHGLVLVCGPTGSGKTSTLAALLQEINLHEARHIITVESPVEYSLVPRKSFIRQREVGRDTPSFEQALLDSLREDPDVLMVGELRDPEVMRLTLAAAETGHLVLATLHSSKASEGLQRLVSAFAPEVQQSVCAQLADVLVGVVAQRLRFNESQKMLVPECEVLMASSPVRALVRQGQFFKLASAMETGAAEGSFTFSRYAEWLAKKTEFVQPSASLEAVTEAPPPALPALKPVARRAPVSDDGALVISEEDDDLSSIIEELEKP
ncbi:MAG: ATPase, T2SS/T4P/T4SS family [Myxococcales bacterium]|nr:ATPase, T2SS/T4P/T4SS family [Myxococcales bacterium]